MGLVILNAVLGGVVVALLIHYALEERLIRRYARVALDGNPGETALVTATRIGGLIYRNIENLDDDRSFVPTMLTNFLGASPGGVLRDGGCCSGKSRLAIVTLHAVGIPAGQITLLHANGCARHCLVEVSCAEGRALIDPSYGLLYVDNDNHVLGLPELRRGTQPRFVSLPGSTKSAYPDGKYYNFDFPNTTTANWTRSCRRRTAHRALRLITHGHVDEIWQPVFLEWPQLMLACGLVALIVFVDLVSTAL